MRTPRGALLAFTASFLLAVPVLAQLSATPNHLTADLVAGESEDHQLLIQNHGNSAVSATIQPFVPGSNRSGRLFIANSHYHGVAELDPATGDVIGSVIEVPLSVGFYANGLAFDGEYLYYTPGGDYRQIFQIDPTSGAIVAAIRMPYDSQMDGLAHNGASLFASDNVNNMIYEIDFHNNEISRTLTMGTSIIGGLTAAGSRGTLFVVGAPSTSNIYEIDPATGETVNAITVPGLKVGLGFSSELNVLFVSEQLTPRLTRVFAVNPDTGAELYELPTEAYTGALAADEAVGPYRWLSVPGTIEVPPRGSVILTAGLDTGNLVEGTYQAEIVITPVDSEDEELVVPVTINVTGVPAGDIDTEEIDFGPLVVGSEAVRPVALRNTGTADLEVLGVMAGHPDLSVAPLNSTIPPGRRVIFEVKAAPTQVGSLTSSVTFHTDAHNQEDLTVAVMAAVVPAPTVVTPEGITIVVQAGEEVFVDLGITNQGDGILTYQLYSGTVALGPGRETPYGYLPAVIDHIGGNAPEAPDVVDVRSQIANDSLFLEVEFYHPIPEDAVYRWVLFLDLDQDRETGYPHAPPLVADRIGHEAAIGLHPEFGTAVFVEYDENWHAHHHHLPLRFDSYTSQVPHYRLRAAIPISLLPIATQGIDAMGWASSPGVLPDFTDIFPETGYGSIGRLAWLSMAETGGHVEPGGQTGVKLGIHATTLHAGTYEGRILLASNDPDQPAVIIPVVLEVEGEPDIAVDPDILAFGDVIVGGSKTLELEVANHGSATGSILGIETGHPALAVEPAEFTLAPGESQLVAVTFAPQVAGDLDATIVLSVDADAHPPVEVSVTGTGVPAPVASVDPAAIELVLEVGEVASSSLTLYNQGKGNLDYEIETRLDGGPDGELPLVLLDPEGDSDGEEPPIDVIAVNGRQFAGSLELEIVFADGFDVSALMGEIALDVDADAETGAVPDWATEDQVIGAEYLVSLSALTLGSVDVREADGDGEIVGQYAATVTDSTVYFQIPLLDIGHPEGPIHLIGVAMRASFIWPEPVDWFPDEGYGVVTGADWFAVTPNTGEVPAFGQRDLQLEVSAKHLSPGDFYGSLVVATNDPAAQELEVSIHLQVSPPVSDEPGAAPLTYALRSVYPNPVQGAVNVEIELPEPVDVRILLFDMLGREVHSEDVGNLPIGEHLIALDTVALASGAYFVQIVAGDYRAAHQITVVR